MSDLENELERVFGLPVALGDPSDIYDRAMKSYRYSRSGDHNLLAPWATKYAGRDDVFRAAIEKRSHYTSDDVFGFLINAVLLTIPFRHEAVWIEIEPPHTVWHYADGLWTELQPALRSTEGQADGVRFKARR